MAISAVQAQAVLGGRQDSLQPDALAVKHLKCARKSEISCRLYIPNTHFMQLTNKVTK